MAKPRAQTHKNTIAFKSPESLREALELLKGNTGSSRVLAGGTDLILQIRRGAVSPSVVVDVKNIPELNVLEISSRGALRIGAAVPLEKIIDFLTASKKFDFILQACSVIGSMQIRNRATMTGNICNAAPSADSAPPLMCLEAVANIASAKGSRKVNLNEFFLGPGKTVVAPDELLVSLEIPKPPPNSAGCYMRHTTREEMDIAVAGVGSFIIAAPDKSKIKEVKIVLGAVAPTPLRAKAAEKILTGQAATESLIAKASEIAAQEAKPISDVRSSIEYRRELVKVLVRRTLHQCAVNLGINIR